MSGFAPGVELRQVLTRATTAVAQAASPYIVAPCAKLIRFSVPAERPSGMLGTYDPVGQLYGNEYYNPYPWPSRPVGATVDQSYTRVHVTDALLRYYSEDSHDAVRVGPNAIKFDISLRDNGADYPKSEHIIDRGVAVGDPVVVRGTIDTEPFVLRTRVIGFDGDMVAASHTAFAAGTANRVDIEDPAGVGTSVSNSNVGAWGISGVDNAYDGTAANRLSETYTVTFIQSSTGSDPTTARIRVISASGTDNVLSRALVGGDGFTPIGTRGLAARFTLLGEGANYLAGDTVTFTVEQGYEAPTITAVGTYTGTKSRKYIVEVVRGGTFDTGPLVRVLTESGEDALAPAALGEGSGNNSTTLPLGSHGLSFKFASNYGLVTGDRWSLTATPTRIGYYNIVKLAHTLPEGVDLNDDAFSLEVDFCVTRPVIEIASRSETPGVYNWTQTPTEIRVYAGNDQITTTLSDITLDGEPCVLTLLGGDAANTKDSKLHVTARYWLARSSGWFAVTDSASLATEAPGEEHPDNPLTYAIATAQANGASTVYGYCVGDPLSQSNWRASLTAIDEFNSVYTLVPQTMDSAIKDMFATYAESRVNPPYNQNRVALVAISPKTQKVVLDDTTSDNDQLVLATILDDPDTTGTQYTLLQVTSANADLLELDVRAGDVVRYNYNVDGWGEATYDEALVDTVISADTLRLVSGPSAAESVARRIEIHRTLTDAEQVDDATSQAAAFGIRSSVICAMGNLEDGTLSVAPHFAAAAIAGRRASASPHEPLQGVALNGFTAAPAIRQFDSDDLNALAYSGITLVVEERETGAVAIRHFITSGDYDNTLEREESIRSNVDSISMQILRRLRPLLRRANAVPELLDLIRAEISAIESDLRSANYSKLLGGQIKTDGQLQILKLYVSPAFKDTIVCQLAVDVPGPANRMFITLYVQ